MSLSGTLIGLKYTEGNYQLNSIVSKCSAPLILASAEATDDLTVTCLWNGFEKISSESADESPGHAVKTGGCRCFGSSIRSRSFQWLLGWFSRGWLTIQLDDFTEFSLCVFLYCVYTLSLSLHKWIQHFIFSWSIIIMLLSISFILFQYMLNFSMRFFLIQSLVPSLITFHVASRTISW